MFCKNCGDSNEDDAKFCIHCGKPLSKARREKKPLTMRMFNDVSSLKKVDLLRGLFDFSFNHFVSSRIMAFLYGLSILSAGLIAFLLVIVGFNASMLFGVFALLIGAPLLFLLSVIYSRVFLETILVVFRIADPTAHIGETSKPRDDIQWKI
jgi:predicted nucleic acid-binding Zn ribbon protein